MHVLGFRRALLTWALFLILPGVGTAQLRSVVSSEIAVSSREAALTLDFQDAPPLSMALRQGEVLVDGEAIGTYTRGDGLDLAWRSLLGQAIALDDGPLAQALVDWNPPEELSGEAGQVALALDRALEEGLSLPQEGVTNLGQGGEITLSLSDEESLLGALLRRTGALAGLAEALEEASVEDFQLTIGEDVEVAEGDEISQSLIVVDGDLDLRGTVDGDVVVADGTARLREGARITGDLLVVSGHVESMGGEVEGTIQDLDTVTERSLDEGELEELREELTRDIRRDLLSSMEREGRSSSPFFVGIFGNLGRAIGDLMENLAVFLVLSVLGVLIVHFAGHRLDVVATTVRRAPAQSAMVGMAGSFLLLPVWILGVVALAVSIIGIPLLLAWIPLFPLAAGLAGLLGYVAVARNVGEWVADQEYRGLEWIRGSNSFYLVVAGIGALMVPAVAASLIRIIGFGLLYGLLAFVGSVIGFLALAIGFGAVLLTRGGRIRPYAAYYDFEEEAWDEERGTGTSEDPYPEDALTPESSPDMAPEAEAEAKTSDPQGSPPDSGADEAGDEEEEGSEETKNDA